MNSKTKSLISITFALWTVCFLVLSFRATAQTTGDNHWDNQFGPVGTSDQLWSVTAVGGNVYVGGIFQSAGNMAANYIAGYDGTNWFKLNNGVTNAVNITYVFSLANDGSNVYAGGWFANADNSGAQNIARWDGTNFYPLAGGNPNSIVEVVKVFGTNIFVGGVFTTNGGVPVNRIARWDSAGWHALGTGITGANLAAVLAIDYDGTNLYAGGTFTNAGSVIATNLARWDGTTWNAMGNPFAGSVACVKEAGGILYVGGTFTNSALGITNFAQWNGSTWTGVNANGTVRDLLWDGTNLYAGGDFTKINGVAANRIAVLNGGIWSPLGVGIEGFGAGAVPGVYRMALDGNGNLFAAGNFNQAGGIGASHVARWDGANWYALGGTTSQGMTHFIGQVRGLYDDGTFLYAGGTFTEAGSNIVNGVSEWNGANWSAMGPVTIGQLPSGAVPRAFISAGGTLYAGGTFTNIGGVPAGGVAYWDGANWNDIGANADGSVQALTYDGTYVWIAGSFTNIGGGLSPGVAAYQPGVGWFTAGGVAGGSQSVNAIVFDGTSIYIGGNFTSVNGVSAVNVAYLNDVGWNAMSSGANNTVNALLAANSEIYAGGSFTAMGGVTVNRIAAWNGSSWSAMISGVTGTSSATEVAAIANIGANVYIAGTFTNASGIMASGIAEWNGSSWLGLGSGLFSTLGTGGPGQGFALATAGNDLYVGGSFTSAGAKPATAISRWNDQLDFYPPPHPYLTRSVWLTNRQFQFRLAGTSGESYILQGSTNLSSWVGLLTNTTPLFDYTDTNASGFPRRFYRAVLGP